MKNDTSGAGWEAARSRVIAIIGMTLTLILAALPMMVTAAEVGVAVSALTGGSVVISR